MAIENYLDVVKEAAEEAGMLSQEDESGNVIIIVSPMKAKFFVELQRELVVRHDLCPTLP